jgi:hypothetical protein
MAFGLMGGSMQAQGHLQLALRILAHGQNPQAAAGAPRWRVLSGRKVAVEPGMSPRLVEASRRAATALSSSGRKRCLRSEAPKCCAVRRAIWLVPTRARDWPWPGSGGGRSLPGRLACSPSKGGLRTRDVRYMFS